MKILKWITKDQAKKTSNLEHEHLLEEHFFHSIFDHHPYPVVLINADGVIVRSNKHVKSQYGYNQKELLGDFKKYIPTESVDHVWSNFHKVFKGKSLTFETKMIHKNKSVIDISVICVPILDKHKDLVGIYVVIRNIDKEMKTKEELSSVKTYLELMQESAKIGSWQFDISSKKASWSSEAFDILGIENSKQSCFNFEAFLSMVHPDDEEMFRQRLNQTFTNAKNGKLELRFITPSNRIVHLFIYADIVYSDTGEPSHYLGTLMDITETKRLETKLKDKEQEAKDVYDSLELGIWSYNYVANEFLFFSDGIERISGVGKEEFHRKEKVWKDLILDEDLAQFNENQKIIAKGKPVEQEYRIVSPDGDIKWVKDRINPIFDENNNVIRVNGFVTDITEHKMLLEKINYLANHDYLTDLPNRRMLKEEMDFLIQNYEESEQSFAVLYIDLDRFKYINDTLGHPVGDLVLKAMADRLSYYQEDGHFVARVGGDEFIILYQGVDKIETIKSVAKELIQHLREPIFVEDYELFLTACIGISVFPIDGETEETLMKHADVALYRAKELGKNYFEIYTPNINVKTYQQFTIERDMHKALKEKQFIVYFQPKVHAQTYQIVGAEALIRWEHPIWGLLSPSEFIPIAEETGMINEIGDYVMEVVLKQINTWTLEGVPLVPISINVSPQRFLRKNYFQQIKRAIEKYRVDPTFIELEITESSFLHNPEFVLRTVKDLRKLGLKVALDDFGTGYSSMTRLAELEIDVLKVDRSFVKDVETNRKNAIILESLFIIAKELEIEVVVEGVETEGQLHFMKQKNCDIIQGYIFSKPVPVSQFTDMLEMRKLLPQKAKDMRPATDRRQFFRIDFPHQLRGELTIKQIKGKDVQLGKAGIVVENIGVGGLRFISNIQFPVRPDLIISIQTTILGETRSNLGKIVWKDEGPDAFYYYGVEFIVTDNERAELTGILNRVAIQLKGSNILPGTNVVKEDMWEFLERLKDE
ncbi:EAL domain-containing protein [Sutcliffiella halmapala]|uniref:EAL domain-containing protein n=1 Tax=Sutcliffiella halmapala TaxID=79882 RepID=UPI0009949D72|nr:EAL domain-containing protein [Sutcliffiella halmapala]